MNLPSNLEKIKKSECHFAYQKFQENYHEKTTAHIYIFNLGLGNVMIWGYAGSWVFLPIIPVQLIGYYKSEEIKKKFWKANKCE